MDKKLIPLSVQEVNGKAVPRALRRYILPASDVLELGCGRGAATLQLVEEGIAARGYEVEAGYLQSAQAVCEIKGLNIKSIFAEGHPEESLPYESSSFDVVWADQVVEHVTDLDFFLREVTRVLRPGGSAWFRYPSGANLFEPHTGLMMPAVLASKIFGPIALFLSPERLTAIRGTGSRWARANGTHRYLSTKTRSRNAFLLTTLAKRAGLKRIEIVKERTHLKILHQSPIASLLGRLGRYEANQVEVIFVAGGSSEIA